MSRLAIAACCTLLLSLGGSDCAEPDGEDVRFFENKVRPLLAQHCYECHSERENKRKGGLLLDRREGWALGGDSGPAVTPGDPGKSLLIESVHYENEDLEMPPEGRLSEAEISTLEEWIRRGAVDPRDEPAAMPEDHGVGIDIEKGKAFWSFQPRQTSGARSIDEVHLKGLETRGFTRGPLASPEVRLRRLYYDLIGLPPSLEDQDAFRADPSQAVWEKTVDRLLASPSFGERWGRHWLDIVRYSDSSGGGRAIPFPDAWRFRDYVIRAFESDKPLDHLIREHLAGDLLPANDDGERMDQVISTGFLVLGPNNYENQDKDLLDLEIADEQIDTMGRAFLGMTISCARCHDHKFDPIPTRDYYGLAGIFLSTQSVKHSNVSAWHRTPLPPTPEQEKALANFAARKAPLNKKVQAITAKLKALGAAKGGDALRGVDPKSLPGIIVDDVDAEKKGDWKNSTFLAAYVGKGYIHDRNEEKGRRSVTFRAVLPKPGRYELRLSYNVDGSRASSVPATVTHQNGSETVQLNERLRPEHGGLFSSIGSWEFGGEVVVEIGTSESNGFVIVDALQILPAADSSDTTFSEEKFLQPSPIDQITKLRKALEAAEKERKALKAPDLPQAMSVADSEEPGDTTIRVRGMAGQHGDEVPRGFLQVTMRADPGRPTSAPAMTGSGRLELAEWVTSEDNPLTARVMANRVWLHLLGRGVVSSPDNFGTTGAAPSDPMLLDHLANRLVAGGWSSKSLIREIVLSEVYQLDAEHRDEAAAGVDPENEMLWRGRRRALDAEAIRDTMLLLGGTLDHSRGGPSLPPGFKSEFGHQFKTKRRSVYVPIFRNRMLEIFQTFDFANPNFTVGQRSDSTIPTQSLFLSNSPFVHDQSEGAAARLRELGIHDLREGARRAFREVLAREPSSAELNESILFLQASGDGDWSALYRALYASVDFRYLR